MAGVSLAKLKSAKLFQEIVLKASHTLCRITLCYLHSTEVKPNAAKAGINLLTST